MKKRLYDEHGRVTPEGETVQAIFEALLDSKIPGWVELYDASDLRTVLSESLCYRVACQILRQRQKDRRPKSP